MFRIFFKLFSINLTPPNYEKIRMANNGDANITDNADAIKAIMNMNFHIKR